ncbi:hypothetical protein ASG39_00650 [Rhizobium sp. Leaf371]|nr:hypothetical protein ASG39_00650 [Rhizobium sp. Leaf371]
MFASLASPSTSSQPVATTGATKIASTPCAMNERSALIWFSCFCWASANFRSMPRFSASCFVTVVSAARQPDSEPICEKPTVMSAADALEKTQPARTVAQLSALTNFMISSQKSLLSDGRI